MELILNDLSLYGQFPSVEDFEAYFLEYLYQVIHLIIEEQIPLYKKSDTYSRMITQNISLVKYLRESSNQPVATLLKKAIIEMAYSEPYWDTDGMQSRPDVEYCYPNKQDEPNCYTEAIERKCPLLSVQVARTLETKIVCYYDDEPIEITDIRDDKELLEAYLSDDVNNVQVVIENYPVGKKVKCAEIAGRCYTKEALLENDLSAQDILKFVTNMRILIQDKSNGRKTHWWDSIKDDIYEYRLSISDGREFRVLFQWGKELTFLNGFIKKTGKTPKEEIKLAERIKNK